MDAVSRDRKCLVVERSHREVYLAQGRKSQLLCCTRTDCETEPIGYGSCWLKPTVGFGDTVSTEVSFPVIFSCGHSCEDVLVREEGYPVGAALNMRFVGGNPAGDTQRDPMFNGFACRKIEPESPPSCGKVD